MMGCQFDNSTIGSQLTAHDKFPVQILNISQFTANRVGPLIAGVKKGWPYRSGPELVNLFNTCGFNDAFNCSFPGQLEYCIDRLLKANGTQRLGKFFELWLMDEFWHEGGNVDVIPECPQRFVAELNAILASDDIELRRKSGTYVATRLRRVDLSAVDADGATQLPDIEWMMELCVDLAWQRRLNESLIATKLLITTLTKQEPSGSTAERDLIEQLRYVLAGLKTPKPTNNHLLRLRLHIAHAGIRDLLHFLHQNHNVVSWR